MDAASRILQLLSMLNDRPLWSGEDLARRLEVTTRTLRRDVARLRTLGYPIEAVGGPTGGYQLGRGRDVPPLAFDDQEVLAVALGLQLGTQSIHGLENAAASALAKLERVLPERLASHLRDVRGATVAASGAPLRTDPQQLLALAQACRQRRRVRFLYVTHDERRSLRHADPSRLVHTAGRWYLVAFDLDRDDWRTFRVDRLRATLPTGVHAAAREEPDALELVRRGRTVAAFPVQATVRLHLALERATALIPPYAGILEGETPTTTLWRLGGSDPPSVASWLAATPCHLEVLDPHEVRDAFARHLRVLQGDG